MGGRRIEKFPALDARNGNLEVPVYSLKVKQGCTVRKIEKKR
jgi:hypothetical protein